MEDDQVIASRSSSERKTSKSFFPSKGPANDFSSFAISASLPAGAVAGSGFQTRKTCCRPKKAMTQMKAYAAIAMATARGCISVKERRSNLKTSTATATISGRSRIIPKKEKTKANNFPNKGLPPGLSRIRRSAFFQPGLEFAALFAGAGQRFAIGVVHPHEGGAPFIAGQR